MRKIDTIENISNQLSATSISAVPKRCVYIRNWHSRCRNCLSACQHEAIERSLGHLSIDSEKCTNCGACAESCPTSAMLTTAPNASEIVRQARMSAERNAGSAAFICARHAERVDVDTERVVVLPCLDYLDEYLIAGMLGLGFERVILFTLGCDGCDVDCEQPYFEHIVDSARKLLSLWNVRGTFATLDEVPSTLIVERHARNKARAIQSDRRDAFKQTGASALGYAFKSVSQAIAGVTGEKLEHPGDRIVMNPDERFPAESYRSVRLLNVLDRIGAPAPGATVDSRFWASVDVDPSLCKHCGICARMCVTQALKFHVDEENRATLTFQPSLCTNCRLCKDSCLSHSMIYSTKVPVSELTSGEVKTLFANEELPVKKSPHLGR